jgi:hypothetical protein
MDKMTPDEYHKWASYYSERYGFKCLPLTGKDRLAMTDDLTWDGSLLRLHNNYDRIDTKLVKGENWIDATTKVAERYSHCLTGIGALCCHSGIVGIDFDDVNFFFHWKRVFQIECPVTKTAKGYHAILGCEKSPRRIMQTAYYDVQAWTMLVLPPSFYYRKAETEAGRQGWEWIRLKDKLDRYYWVHEMTPPKVNLYEVGLLPRWFLDGEQDGDFFVLNEEPPRDIKMV